MTDLIAAAVVTYALINIMTLMGMGLENRSFAFVNPFYLYKTIKVNWFGAFLMGSIFSILLPMISIPYWIYKLCTVGRR